MFSLHWASIHIVLHIWSRIYLNFEIFYASQWSYIVTLNGGSFCCHPRGSLTECKHYPPRNGRISLCMRNIDRDINCPDACRAVPENFCEKQPHTTSGCSYYLDDMIAKNTLEYTTVKLESRIRDWLRSIPMERRLPIEFYLSFADDVERFNSIIRMQKMTAMTAYCPCRVYYRVSHIQMSFEEHYCSLSSVHRYWAKKCLQIDSKRW